MANALDRFDLQRGFNQAVRQVQRELAEATGANSEPVVAGAQVLVKEWRRLVSAKASGANGSAPGQPPKRRKGKLRRSIGTAVVEGARRVGSSSHVSRKLEFGVNQAAADPRDFKNQRGSFKGRKTKARKGLVIEPRPSLRPALENVADQMADVIASGVQKRMARKR